MGVGDHYSVGQPTRSGRTTCAFGAVLDPFLGESMRALLTCVVAVLATGPALADAQADQAKTALRAFNVALEVYKVRYEKYPATLKELVDAKFVSPTLNTTVDPWGNDYKYDAKGPRNGGRKPDIWAEAPDKTIIGNWPDPKGKKP